MGSLFGDLELALVTGFVWILIGCPRQDFSIVGSRAIPDPQNSFTQLPLEPNLFTLARLHPGNSDSPFSDSRCLSECSRGNSNYSLSRTG
jgi:hypothetical protein